MQTNEHLLEQIEGVITFLVKEQSEATIGGIGNHSTPEQLDRYNRASQSLGHLIHYRDTLVAETFDHQNDPPESFRQTKGYDNKFGSL